MRRRSSSLGLGGLLLVLATLIGVGPLSAQEPPDPNNPTVTTAPVPPPAASIVVDADTGEVLSATDARTPMRPASTSKLLTALLVRQQLELDADIGVSPTATLTEPRRLGLQAGTQWGVDDLLYAAILCSCNDAAWALGQAAGGGTMEGFASATADLADTLGLADDPVVRDPAGLDDERSVGGGNQMSARDLAIVARAVLADPELATIAATPRYEWLGGDGQPHSVTNLNPFLAAYPGAVGLKTGTTEAAGSTFVGAAERDGRTLIAVVYRSDARFAEAAALLDAGFLRAEAGDATDDVLPPVPAGIVLGAPVPPSTTVPATTVPATGEDPSAPENATDDEGVAVGPASPPAASGDDGLSAEAMWMGGGAAAVLVGGGVATVAIRRSGPRDRIDRRPARPRRRHRRRRKRARPRALS